MKKFKYVEDLVEEYLKLSDEGIELPLAIAKATKKADGLLNDQTGEVIKKNDLEDIYKAFSGIKKLEERQTELKGELEEVESQLKDFLLYIKDKKISYEKWDDAEKIKLTYLFWLENNQIKSNRK